MPGRFEPVDEGQDFGVLVDYAHTPDSLENVLRAAREVTRGGLIVVFGAGGDRDRGKRPLMGDAARRLADRVLVTSDNPRSERPDAIIDEIMEGAGKDAEREPTGAARSRRDRQRRPGDVVVIAGKGHEQGQEFENGRKEPFDDLEVAREALQARPAPAGGGVIDLSAARIADAAQGELVAGAPERRGPERAVIDSRAVGPATCSPACPAPAPTAASSRRALSSRRLGRAGRPGVPGGGARGGRGRGRRQRVRVCRGDRRDPLQALQLIAREWRRALGCRWSA